MTRFSSGFCAALGAAAVFTIFVQGARADTSERGREIAEKLRENYAGFSGETFSGRMEIQTGSGEVTRRLEGRVLEEEGDDQGDKLILEVNFPPDVEGTRVLIWARLGESNDQWVYLPASESTRRITGRNVRAAFLGSEFSYEDLMVDEVDDYTYEYRGEDTFQGRDAWVIEREPVNEHSGYSKHVVWVDQEYHAELKTEFYDRGGDKLKTFIFTGHHNVDGLGYRASRMLAGNHQNGNRTVWHFRDHRLGAELDESDFRPDALDE